jgi:iron complex transport system permease protein
VKKRFIFPTLILILILLFSLTQGAVPISLNSLFHILIYKDASSNSLVLWDIRFPRIILAILVGASLSVAGGLLQTIFRNPLADPSIMGISTGTSLGTVIALLLGVEFGTSLSVAFGVLGGSIAIALIFIYAHSRKSSHAAFLLFGVALNSLLAALFGIILSATKNPQSRSISFWAQGTLSLATWGAIISILPFFIIGLLIAIYQSKYSNVLTLSDIEIRTLGINPFTLRIILSIAAAILVASATSIVGIIAFVGLITPFALRLIYGPDLRFLIPLSALWGSVLLLLSDTLARTLIHNLEIPISMLVALIGAPIFMWILIRKVKI